MTELQVPIRIKRGVGGAPSQLLRGELAYSESENRLYIGKGASGSNDASGRPIAATVEQLLAPAQFLATLFDVAISSGPNDGDVLTYDASEGEWIAQAVAAASVAWDDVTSKPSTFAPSTHASSHHTGGADAIAPADIGAAAASHTHAASDITSGLATVATTGAYSDLSGTPTLGTAAYLDTTDFVESQAASTFGLSLLDDADAAAARTTLGLGSAATVASTAFADVDHSHEWSDITSGVPSTFAPSAHNHTIKQELSGFIESPEVKTYVLTPSTHAAMTITQLKAQTSVGTVDIELHDDSTIVTDASLADAGTTLASLASDISVVVAAGSKLALVVSDPQSSPENLAFTVYYTIASENNS
jgi:hypothetical protein